MSGGYDIILIQEPWPCRGKVSGHSEEDCKFICNEIHIFIKRRNKLLSLTDVCFTHLAVAIMHHHVMWGSTTVNERSEFLLEFIMGNKLSI